MVVPTLLKVLLAFLPSVVIAAMHTTMINASITAYSTAVGPSSLARKSVTERVKRDSIGRFLSVQRSSSRRRAPGQGAHAGPGPDPGTIARRAVSRYRAAPPCGPHHSAA